MVRVWATALGLSLGLGGCAHVNDASLTLFSSSRIAYAIVDEQVLTGDMQFFHDRTATLALRSDPSAGSGIGASPAALTSCVGRMRYSATNSGAMDLRCNGGVVADVQVTLMGETRGYGYGSTATGAASLAFGMSQQEAKAHLAVPANRQLVERDGSPYFELK